MIQNRLLLVVPVAVIFAAAVSGTVAVVGTPEDRTNFSCARTTVDLTSGNGDSNSIDIVALVDGSSGASISQQVSQFDGRIEVDIDIGYDDQSVAISGETVENGSLVLEVTRNDTVVNESVVVNGSDHRAVVFRIDTNGDVRISREEASAKCLCETGSAEAEVNVDADGVGVDTDEEGSVEVNIEDDDSDDDPVYETDGGQSTDCSESVSCTCSDSSTELSPPERPSARFGPQLGTMWVITRSHELVGLAKPGRDLDCVDASDESTADCPLET